MRKAAAVLAAILFGPIALYFAFAGAYGVVYLLAALVSGDFGPDWVGRHIMRVENPDRFWFLFICGAAVDFAGWMAAAVVYLPLRTYVQTRFGETRTGGGRP